MVAAYIMLAKISDKTVSPKTNKSVQAESKDRTYSGVLL